MSEPGHKKLGELLLEHGAIDAYQLSAALAHQRQWGGKIGRVLIELKFASEESICDALALQLGIPSVRVQPGSIDATLLRTLPQDLCQKNYVLPLGLTGEPGHERLRVAMSDPTNVAVVDELRFRTGKRIDVVCAPEAQIEAALRMEFSGEIPLPEKAPAMDDAYFAGREIDLDLGEAPAAFSSAEATPVDVLGDGLLPGEQMLDLPMSGLTPGPTVVGTFLGSNEPPGRAMLDWEAPPIPPLDPTRTPPSPPRWPPVSAPPPNRVAPNVAVAPPVPQRPPAAPRAAPRASPPPRPPPVPKVAPAADEVAAAAERRAEEAARLVSEPVGAALEAELLFRKAAEQQKLAEVGEAAVEKLEALGRPLSPAEAAVLLTLEDMAAGREVARPIPPGQMVAALVRLLIRRGLIADSDIIEELSRK